MDIKICKNFNLCIKDFLKDILLISSISKLKTLSYKINKLYTVNICRSIIINKFIENIVPLNEHIKNQNSIIFEIVESDIYVKISLILCFRVYRISRVFIIIEIE